MKQLLRSGKLLAASGLLMLTAAISILSPGTAQQPNPMDQYDFVVEVESKPLKNYFSWSNSKFKDFSKLDLKITDLKGKSSQDFEQLFTCTQANGQTGLLACHRLANLQIEAKKHVAIKMKFSDKGASEKEVRSAAYAVPPLLLELHQLYKDNDDIFAGDVYVPAESYETFKQSLNNQGFQPMDQGSSTGTTGFPVHLIQDPGGEYKVLYYQQTVKKKT